VIKFCYRCGSQNLLGVKHCYQCGELIEKVNQQKRVFFSTSTNLIVRHWRGELPLIISFWGVLFFGWAVTLLGLIYLTDVMADSVPESLFFRGFSLAFPYLTLPIILSWMMIGTWRSACIFIETGGERFWAITTKITIVILMLRASFDAYQLWVPNIVEGLKLATGIGRAEPIVLLRDKAKTDMVHLYGEIEYGSLSDIVTKHKNNPFSILVLHSIGGRIEESIKIARFVASSDIETMVNSECSSACTLIFIAGKHQYLEGCALLGFHSAHIGWSSSEVSGVFDKYFFDAYQKFDIDEAFIKKVLAVPSEDMWYPNYNELVDANVIKKRDEFRLPCENQK
jgi:hypothetical protein